MEGKPVLKIRWCARCCRAHLQKAVGPLSWWRVFCSAAPDLQSLVSLGRSMNFPSCPSLNLSWWSLPHDLCHESTEQHCFRAEAAVHLLHTAMTQRGAKRVRAEQKPAALGTTAAHRTQSAFSWCFPELAKPATCPGHGRAS